MPVLFSIFLSAFVLILVQPSAARDWSTVRIGFEGDYPPFSTIDSAGYIGGFDVDIAGALCKEAGVSCKYYSAHEHGGMSILPLWLSGRLTSDGEQPPKIDVILSSMMITETRRDAFAFTRPYYRSSNALAVPLRYWDEVGEIKTTTDLDGKTVSVVAGSPQEAYARKHFPGADIQTYPSTEELLSAFAAIPAPAFLLADSLDVYPWIEKGQEGSCCKTLGAFWADPEINGEGYGIAFRKSDDDLRQRFDAALVAILKNGTYDEIARKYFTFDLYAGDRP